MVNMDRIASKGKGSHSKKECAKTEEKSINTELNRISEFKDKAVADLHKAKQSEKDAVDRIKKANNGAQRRKDACPSIVDKWVQRNPEKGLGLRLINKTQHQSLISKFKSKSHKGKR